MKADSLAELYSQKKKQIIQDCDLCGVCLEVCPAIPITSLATVPASDILGKVIAVLKDGIISEEASIRAASCMHCVKCQDSCPQGINPVIMQELLLYELTKLGKKRYPLMELKLGDSKLFVPDIMASMQVKQPEKDWLTHVPDKPQQKDVVVFTGCAMLMMPDKIFLIRDILQSYVEAHGYSVVREYSGHGIGRDMHEEPLIPNFGKKGEGIKLREGMTLALEPMVNRGGWETRLSANGWTVHTADKSLSAHFEHTIAIRKNEAEILTLL